MAEARGFTPPFGNYDAHYPISMALDLGKMRYENKKTQKKLQETLKRYGFDN